MRKKIYLPKSIEELEELSSETLQELWQRYFTHRPLLPDRKMIRTLWYKIQCENHNLHLPQKYITKLNRYASDPDSFIEKAVRTRYHIRSGTEIVKTYKGSQHRVLIRSPHEVVYQDQVYPNLSAAAKAICGKKVSGYDFFGLNNKRYARGIVEGVEEAE